MAVNYQMDVINPFQAALQGYGAGAQMLQQERTAERQVRQDEQQGQLFGLQMQEAQLKAQQARQEMADAEAMKTTYAEFNDVVQQAREANDPSLIVKSGIIDRLAVTNSALAKYGQGVVTELDDAKKLVAHKSNMELAVPGLMRNWDVMTSKIQEKRDAYAASGEEEQVKFLDAMLAQSKDPKMRETVADTFLARAIDLNAKATSDQLDTLGKGIQLPLDEELTRAQIRAAQAEETRARDQAKAEAMMGSPVQSAVEYGNGTVLFAHKDGTTTVRDPTGKLLTGEAAAQAIAEGNQFQINYAGQLTGTKAAASLGQKQVGEAFTSVNKIRTNMGNLDQVVAAIDNGASTGLIESMVPAWNAATLEIRRLQGALGIDVINSATFGALSDAELQLALSIGLPTNMQPADLRKWALDKKEAQRKLAGYLEEQARYLSIPGTNVAGWLEKLRAEGRGTSQGGGAAGGGGVPDGAVIERDANGRLVLRK
jgi:hypothetical protein